MVKDSLKKLMDMFPWFFDKSTTSNFYKSQDVTNRRFKELYNDFFKIYQSFQLNKKLLIWKEQSEPYEYIINFVANFPNLKLVNVCKNGEVIYTESYDYDEHENTFEYSYSHSTLDDVEDETLADIIPQDTFTLEVETYDEYFLVKGFPENDELLNDVFDHDVSLDRMGKLNNIPRKTYVETDDYDNTEPKYNDRLTEDDYHYMRRMLEYNLRLHTTPAPVLELWKLYGVETEMFNRERKLLKLFDIFQHPHHYNEDGELVVDDWEPQPWEHKDKFCDEKDLLGRFFFAIANTVIPVKRQPVLFNFYFVNSLAQALKDENVPYVVDIYLNDNSTPIIEGYESRQWKCDADLLDEYGENVFRFVGRQDDVIIGETEIIVMVRGCNTADWYVKADSTETLEDGSRDYPFKTLEKAVAKVNASQNLIAVFGNVTTKGNIPVKESCTILGCNNAKIINTTQDVFFNVPQNVILTTQDMMFQTDHFTSEPVETILWTNENKMKLSDGAIAYNLHYGVLISDLLPEKFIKNLDFDEDTGILSWEEYSISEFTKLSDFWYIVANLALDNDGLTFTLSEIYETEEKYLDGQFVFFEDRQDLNKAISNMSFNQTNGLLSFDELEPDDIVYGAKVHDILGAE